MGLKIRRRERERRLALLCREGKKGKIIRLGGKKGALSDLQREGVKKILKSKVFPQKDDLVQKGERSYSYFFLRGKETNKQQGKRAIMEEEQEWCEKQLERKPTKGDTSMVIRGGKGPSTAPDCKGGRGQREEKRKKEITLLHA